MLLGGLPTPQKLEVDRATTRYHVVIVNRYIIGQNKTFFELLFSCVGRKLQYKLVPSENFGPELPVQQVNLTPGEFNYSIEVYRGLRKLIGGNPNTPGFVFAFS